MAHKKQPRKPAADDGNSATDKKLDLSQGHYTPWQVIQSYDDGTWEQFIAEWSEAFEPAYHQVVRLGGAGDKGRDLVAYADDPAIATTPWDNYQCKRYKDPLAPTDVYVELGKLCFYTQRGDFTVPRKYYFCSPKGVGTKLHDMLKNPDVLRAELFANWDTYCRREIQAEEVSLTSELKAYIEAFDFTIVWFKTPQQLLEQHRRTKYWYQRFKIEPPKRPDVPALPTDIQKYEMPYVNLLLEAYSDHLKTDPMTLVGLAANAKLFNHFKRSRGYFFSAEALARFSRDHFAPGTFNAMKLHVYDGIADIPDEEHTDAYQCILAVTTAAANLPLPASDLQPYVSPGDKKGICHHLANDGDLTWKST